MVETDGSPWAPITNSLGLRLRREQHRPVEFAGFEASRLLRFQPLVEVFTTREQRARTSKGYLRSSIGARLRYVLHQEVHRTDGDTLEVVQADHESGIWITTTFQVLVADQAVRITQTVVNMHRSALTLLAVPTAVIGAGHDEHDGDSMTLARADSTWLAESRWTETPVREVLPRLALDLHEQDGRGRFAVTSHGAWPTGEHLPIGILVDEDTAQTLAWQIDAGTAWQWSLSDSSHGTVVSLTGPADIEHHFARTLEPEESFTSVPVTVVIVDGGRDAAIAALTASRRRMIRDQPAGAGSPIIYNDFMNTLMGDPSTEKLLPLIAGAAAAGAEYFCIDAGWFADEVDWWNGVGEWREAPSRFGGGLRAVIDAIVQAGMTPGLWLEPEVVGVRSRAARELPAEAFFTRFGERISEHERFHLDFRHAAARAHLDTTVDHLVDEYGIGFLKLDYNIDIGPGTDHAVAAAGAGLLDHSRAFIEWLERLRDRHPALLIENCASGAMRMDYGYLAHSHIQSTSDQQDHLLSAAIAAASTAAVVPEQAGNWSYPAASMSDGEIAVTMVNGLAGRMVLSGFLDRLDEDQQRLVAEAVDVAKRTRQLLAASVPSWPIGLPGWDDEILAVAFRSGSEILLAVWNRSDSAHDIQLPDLPATGEVLYPSARSDDWTLEPALSGLRLRLPAGPTAAFIRLGAEVGTRPMS